MKHLTPKHFIPLIVAFISIPLAAEIDRSFSKSDKEIDAFYGIHSNRSASAQRAALAGIEKRLEQIDEFTRDSNIEFFGERLRKLARKNIFQVPQRIAVFDKVQQTLLSIPGHAEFYAESIWESYAAYRNPDHPMHTGSLTWFSREIQTGMETLKHLPSPESVKALGGMLWEEWERQPGPSSKVDPAQSMAKYAVTALTLLNIRDAPSAAIEQYSAPDVLADWQAWFEQIKSGQRSFSFKGQAVEYRFKPDGTWETTPIANPPDDAPEVQEARPADRRPVAQETKGQPQDNAGKAFLPYMPAALAALLALAAAWFGMRRMKPRA